MGAKVSTFKHPKALTDPISPNDLTPQSCIIELLKPECLKVKKKKKKQRSLTKAEMLTSEKCLLASPSFDQVILANTDVGEVCVLKPSKVHLSCLGPVDNAALSLMARDSLSSERPVNTHAEVEDKCPSEVCDNAALSLMARDSLSLERPVNTHAEVEDKCPSEVCNMRRSENGRSRKRVRFRLPQESDIFLFCSPGERPECDETSDAIL